MNVPVGSTTKVGWGAAATAFGAALITYLTGDQSAQQTTSVELAGGALVLLVVTHGFRYLQSLLHIKNLGAVFQPLQPLVEGEPSPPVEAEVDPSVVGP